MKISALFPYKPDYGRRDFLWSLVKQRYERLFPQIELCLGMSEGEPFNRAQAINRAAKIASGEIYLLVDTDVIFDVDLINKIQLYIHVHPWIVPFERGIRLTPEATERLIKRNLPEQINVPENDVQEVIIEPGPFMNVMTKSCFEAIHGLDERFQGWGREDDAMVMCLDTICGRHYRMKDAIYHLWHQPAAVVPEFINENDKLLYRYMDARGSITEMKKIVNEFFW